MKKRIGRRSVAGPLLVVSACAAFVSLSGCGGSGSKALPVTRSFTYDFQSGTEGFTAGFADLPPNYDPAIYELDFGLDTQPSPLPVVRNALRIEGHNRSDDLFMFVTRKMTGLAPNTDYNVAFEVEFLSDAPTNSVGAGGSPGSGVIVKAGALTGEPTVAPNNDNSLLVLNADKGNQSVGGSDLKVLGDIGIPGDQFQYTYKTLEGDAPRTVRTDAAGSCWIIVGTDSGFEGKTRLYYSRVAATFTPRP
jgi:hypothetical protein